MAQEEVSWMNAYILVYYLKQEKLELKEKVKVRGKDKTEIGRT